MSSKGLLAGTIGCVLLAWVQITLLIELMPKPELGPALFGCVLACILTGLGLAGHRGHRRSGLPTVLTVALIACGFVVGIQIDVFPSLAQNNIVGLFGIAVGVALGSVLRLGRPRRTISTFLCAGATGILLLNNSTMMTAANVLGVYLIIALSLVVFHAGETRDLQTTSTLQSQSGSFQFRSLDVVLAAVLLFPDAALPYLIAWCFAMTCACLLAEINRTLGSHVSRIWNDHSRSDFVAAAARTNLGFLLIGGGGIAFVFAAAQTLLEQSSQTVPQVSAIMVWLFLSHCGPVLMGASDLFMDITGMRLQQIWILSLWGPVALAATFVLAPTDPVHLAMLVAGLRLGYSVHASVVLGMYRGIWPGLTALLQKNLKLT